jgi:hypothetical protein
MSGQVARYMARSVPSDVPARRVRADVASMPGVAVGAERDTGDEEEAREQRAAKEKEGYGVLRGHPDASWLQDRPYANGGMALLTP